MERWKPIRGYEDRYEVSDHGRVRSLATGEWKLRKLSRIGGYWYLPLRKAGEKPRNFYVHRLVAQAFVAGHGDVVRHKDDTPGNNHHSNLVWGSHADNVADKVAKNRQHKGSAVKSAKLNEGTAKAALRLCAEGKSDVCIAREFGVSRSAVTYLRLRKTWKHVTAIDSP